MFHDRQAGPGFLFHRRRELRWRRRPAKRVAACSARGRTSRLHLTNRNYPKSLCLWQAVWSGSARASNTTPIRSRNGSGLGHTIGGFPLHSTPSEEGSAPRSCRQNASPLSIPTLPEPFVYLLPLVQVPVCRWPLPVHRCRDARERRRKLLPQNATPRLAGRRLRTGCYLPPSRKSTCRREYRGIANTLRADYQRPPASRNRDRIPGSETNNIRTAKSP